MIREIIITSRNADGSTHIAPMGVREEDGLYVVAPFRPSRTLDNLAREKCAVMNFTDDVRVYAGALTGRYDWPLCAATRVDGFRLRDALNHAELEVRRFEDDPQRPRFYCAVVHQETHAPFRGFNRAQTAVLEAAILVSRLHRLPAEKVQLEMEYLRIAVDKTAGEREREAWGWLEARIAEFNQAGIARSAAS
ncbi:MAG: DUF447 family protein [Gammaproteobacteria bacterium]|nr:DUF447 family protein [Gammaproteobacteria bacterium]